MNVLIFHMNQYNKIVVLLLIDHSSFAVYLSRPKREKHFNMENISKTMI